MGLITFEHEFLVAVHPAKLLKAFCLDTDTLIPKILPQDIKSSKIVEGNGGPGTIRKVTFVEGKEINHVKHKIETIDVENFAFSFSLVETDVWKDGVEKVIIEYKFVLTPEGGSILKRRIKCFIKDGVEIKEDEIKKLEIKKHGKPTEGMLKAVEAYFLANPDA